MLPKYTSFVRVGTKPSGWECGQVSVGINLVECRTDATIASGTTLDFTIVAKLDAGAPLDKKIQNIVTACKKDDPQCDPVVCDPDVKDCCEILPDGTRDPACIQVEDDSFDLSIKKYINSEDAESAIRLSTNGTFDYVLKVKNEGPAKVSGTTFVTDTLPAGVERTNTALVTNEWTCTMTDRALSCNIIREVARGAEFPEIRIPVRITATGTTTVTNEACVSNDREKEGKKKGQDPRNCDKAVFDVTEVCTSGCVNPLQCTSISVANNKVTCE